MMNTFCLAFIMMILLLLIIDDWIELIKLELGQRSKKVLLGQMALLHNNIPNLGSKYFEKKEHLPDSLSNIIKRIGEIIRYNWGTRRPL